MSVFVQDQDKALDFYVNTLGFEKRTDVPVGEWGRWIEVALPGTQTVLALEPASLPIPKKAATPTSFLRLPMSRRTTRR